MTVASAGDGAMSITIDAAVDSCTGAGFCGWYPAVRERHATLPCADDRVFRPVVGAFQLRSGSVQETRTFRPFFPRTAKLCLYAKSPFGLTELLAEATYKVPRGYGFVRSQARRCADFESQAAAQYYLYMFPDDPSGLDADRNGLACEENECPCEAELIPAEPPESPKLCTRAKKKRNQAVRAVKVVERRLRKAERPVSKRRWNQALRKRKATLRKTKRQIRRFCRPGA